MKATYKKVECEVCGKSIDVRGFRSHHFKHKREQELAVPIPGGPRLVSRSGNQMQLFPLDKDQPYATAWAEGFRLGYQAAWADARAVDSTESTAEKVA
jgi:hypothetical protein